MKHISLVNWSAWAPGLETKDEWEKQKDNFLKISSDGVPKLEFVHPRIRRRFSRLSKVALQTAFNCCPENMRDSICTVFASRHGDMDTTLVLMRDLAANSLLSPHKFSHSVHNTPIAHYSILTQNKLPSSAISGSEAAFSYGFLEAVTMLHRYPGKEVLFITADCPLEEPLQKFDTATSFPYSLGLLLSLKSETERLQFSFSPYDPENTEETSYQLPQALLFIRWLLDKKQELTLISDRKKWVWQKI